MYGKKKNCLCVLDKFILVAFWKLYATNKDGQFVSCFIGYKLYVNDKDPQRKEIPVCFWGYFDKYWAN